MDGEGNNGVGATAQGAQVFQFPKQGAVGDTFTTMGPTLARGATGQAVRDVQSLLKQMGYSVDIDGLYGEQTATAVKAFQVYFNSIRGALVAPEFALRTDGTVDAATWNALQSKKGSRPGAQGTAAVTYSFSQEPSKRPLWQWGLVAAGIIGLLYWAYRQSEQASGMAGYRSLLSDEPESSAEKVVGGHATRAARGRCTRTPDRAKLVDAEEIAA